MESVVLQSQHAYEYLRYLLVADVEEVWVMALDFEFRVNRLERLFRGSRDSCLVHPRDIFRFAILVNASAFILAHNHPGGDREPSREDVRFTHKIAQLGRMMNIPLVDHLILTTDGYTSMADLGLLDY